MKPEEIRALLAQNAAHTRRAIEYGVKAREAMQTRLSAVQAQLDALPAGDVMLDDEKAAQYDRLVRERGRLSNLTA